MLISTNKKSIPEILRTLYLFINKHFNLSVGALSGLAMGVIVFYINFPYGFLPALGSFGKQFFFNLLMAGYNTRTCEKIVDRYKHKTMGLFFASVLPTTQAFIILYAIHYFGNTPKPMESTWWQAAGNLLFFLGIAILYRKRREGKLNTFRLKTLLGK